MKVLDDKTLIPLGVAVGIIGGAAVWMTKMDIAVSTAQAAIIEQKQADAQYHSKVCELLKSIDQRLSRIEGMQSFRGK